MGMKEEAQGSRGYIKKIRDIWFPNSQEMANLAFERYQEQLGEMVTAEYICNNADDVLRGLFIAETQIFNEKNAQFIPSVIPVYYQTIFGISDQRYPETSGQITRMVDLFNQCRENRCEVDYFMHEVSEVIGPMMDIISFSQKQSAKSRVGNTLQNHLQKMFEICGVPNDSQQQRDDGGTIMDFVIPSLEAYSLMPDQVINIECQTTLKDRFRLTTGKSTDARIKRYLATATGCRIVNDNDFKDLTIPKVSEIVIDNNITLIVFEEVKDAILNRIRNELESARLAGNEVNIRDMEHLLRLCNNKVISYKELINRDIRSVLTYWN